ncbi:MAG: discoidin domain-containing protein, partial [Clostridia bacterium]|nr:discoidin domain-containing protein [Clostridia bacterium]
NNNEKDQNGWMEGAWVVKHEGKYYFNYAVPGTEYTTYADGCYVSDKPMGPFTFCENSPVSYKSTGYLVGAGHGATFQDLWGNWWKVDTVAIAGETSWERRIELIPLTYDKNGNQITDTLMLDYPTYVPALIEDNFGDQAQPDWHLLSYNATVSASSTLDAAHDGKNAVNESIRSWWSAKTGNAGEWITIDMGKLCAVNAIQINFADQDADVFTGRDHTFCYNYLVEFSGDGNTWYTLVDHTGVTAEAFQAKDTSHDYYELASAIGARYIRVTNKGAIPANGKFALSGIRVFGHGGGEAPAQVEDFTVSRPAMDERRVTVTWDAVPGAEGYIVRYGYDRDVLSQAYQVIGGTSMDLRALNMGVDYWFTVDSYNDSGYTKGTTIKKARATKPAPEGTPVAPPKVIDYIVKDYTVYEAESGTLGGGAVISRAAEDAKASGGAAVHNMHLAGAYFEISGIEATGGEGVLHIGYANGNAQATVEIFVNGESQGRVSLKTSGGWDRFKAVEIPITGLKAGEENTIRIAGGIDDGFNPDHIQVLPAE